MTTFQDPRPGGEEGRERELLALLQRAWTYSFSTKSDDARVNADTIAEAASRGFLTTLVVPGSTLYGRLWKVTPEGTSYLYANGHLIAQEEASAYVQEFTR